MKRLPLSWRFFLSETDRLPTTELNVNCWKTRKNRRRIHNRRLHGDTPGIDEVENKKVFSPQRTWDMRSVCVVQVTIIFFDLIISIAHFAIKMWHNALFCARSPTSRAYIPSTDLAFSVEYFYFVQIHAVKSWRRQLIILFLGKRTKLQDKHCHCMCYPNT